MNTQKIYIYTILGQSKGVVFADSKDKAEQKVIEAYKKHDSLFNDEIEHIVIEEIEKSGGWFADSPDVLEVAEIN